MVVLIAWIVAGVVAAVTLGIVGFQVVGQARRLNRSLAALRNDVEPRLRELQAALPQDASPGRHRYPH